MPSRSVRRFDAWQLILIAVSFAMTVVAPRLSGATIFENALVLEGPTVTETIELTALEALEPDGESIESVEDWVNQNALPADPSIQQSLLRTRPFGAATGCAPTQYRIIQQICGTGYPTQALIDFENEAIAQWLAERGLEDSQQQKLYEYGRMDLRSQLREHIFHKLLERARFSGFGDPVARHFLNQIWTKEKALYQAAVNDKALFMSDRCAWRPNEIVAAQYKLKFDYMAWCSPATNLIVLFKTPLIPTKSYFLATAAQSVYLHNTGEVPGAAAIALQMLNQTAELLGLSAIGAVATNAAPYAVAFGVPKAKAAIFPHRARKEQLKAVRKTVSETVKKLPKVGNKLTSTLLKGGLKVLKGGPLFIVGLAFESGMAAGQRAIENNETFNDIKSLDTDLARLQSTPPSITAMIDDDFGRTKLRAAFMDWTMPEMESPLQPPALPPDSEQIIFTHAVAGEEPSRFQPTFSYIDWDENEFETYVVDKWFVSNGDTADGDERLATFTPILKYLNQDKKQYTVGFYGRHFAVGRDVDHVGFDCPPDLLTGVSEPPEGYTLNDCSTYVTDEIVVLQPQDDLLTPQISVVVSIPSPPNIVAPDRIAFTRGVPRELEIGFQGFPTPGYSISQGSLPTGVTLVGTGLGKAKFVYDGNGPDATNAITLRAAYGDGVDEHTMTLYVRTKPGITSPGSVDIKVGVPVDFTVTTTGSLPIALKIDGGILPPGVTFADKGNGTASIQGNYGGEFLTHICIPFERPCGIHATPDVLDPVLQPFKVNYFAAPKPVENTGQLFAPNNEWIAGVHNEKLLVNSAPTITPVHYKLYCNPAWLSLTDHGDGTATLWGTPPRVTSSVTEKFRVDVWANGDASLASGGFFPLCTASVLVHSAVIVPRFRYSTNQYSGFLIAGQSGTTLVEINQTLGDPSVQISGSGYLPPGVTFNPNSGSNFVNFSGTPGANAGGLYPYEITVTNPFITETLPFLLTIKQRPKIITEANANFPATQTSSFLIQATGFPLDTMEFSVVGNLPGTITLLQEPGAPYATLTGNPGLATGDYPVTIKVRNDPDGSFVDQQSFVVHVGPGGDVNSDGTLSCLDYNFVRGLFGKRRGHVGYDPRADLNGDDLVDLRDLALVLRLLELAGGSPCV